MQIKPIIYESLTPRQRIIATIDAEARGDKEEVQRLVQTCQKKNYRENDAAYGETIQNLMYVALGVECELSRNALAFMTAIYLDYGIMKEYLQNIIDIRTAWHETLESMGISPESMDKANPLKSSTSATLIEVLPLPKPKADNVAIITETMKSFFPAG